MTETPPSPRPLSALQSLSIPDTLAHTAPRRTSPNKSTNRRSQAKGGNNRVKLLGRGYTQDRNSHNKPSHTVVEYCCLEHVSCKFVRKDEFKEMLKRKYLEVQPTTTPHELTICVYIHSRVNIYVVVPNPNTQCEDITTPVEYHSLCLCFSDECGLVSVEMKNRTFGGYCSEMVFAMGIQANGARYIAPTIAFVEDDEQDVVPKEFSHKYNFHLNRDDPWIDKKATPVGHHAHTLSCTFGDINGGVL